METKNTTATIQGKTLIVNQENHRNLTQIKLDGSLKSIDEVISLLLKEYQKIQRRKERKNGK